MTPDEVANELRTMLRDGCTVSQLVGHAVERLGGKTSLPRVAMFVRETFGLHPGGWNLLSATESFGTGREPDSKLTWVFLRDILENRPRWDTADREPAWYDGLTKTSFDNWQAVAETNHGLSPEGWAALGEDDRRRVIGLEKMRLAWSEDIQILAALAEQLQRRVNELERQQRESLVS